MKEHVITFQVDAYVAGTTLPVQDAVLTIAVNAIPQIELICAPTESKGKGVNVMKPVVDDFVSLYDKLSNAAQGLDAEGFVEIIVFEDMKVVDRIRLSDWVLAGVGMSGVSTSNAPTLSVIMQHRICKLTKAGGIYEEPRDPMYDTIKAACKGKDKYTEISAAVYDAVAKGDYFETVSKEVAGIAKKFRTALGEKQNQLPEYLEDQTSVFLGPYLNDGFKDIMRQAEGYLAKPRFGSMSSWDCLLEVSGIMVTSVIQDENNNFTTDKLILAPTAPWKKSTITIDDDICESFELPGMDPFKMAGVLVDKFGLQGLHVNEGTFKGPGKINESQKGSTCVMYSPANKVEDAEGRVVKVGIPQLLTMAANADGAFGSAVISEGTTKGGEEAYAKDLEEALVAYCKGCYRAACRGMVRSGIVCRLGFRDKAGKLIVPGQGCAMKSNGNVIYYGYIQQVVHVLSTKGGNSTSITLSHVRKDESYKIGASGGSGGYDAIPANARNSIYEKD